NRSTRPRYAPVRRTSCTAASRAARSRRASCARPTTRSRRTSPSTDRGRSSCDCRAVIIELRGADPSPGLHVVLVQPEIPPNTGTIAGLGAATGTRLHLVRPLGFSLEDRYLRRAGLDYWPHVDLRVHDDWSAFIAAERPGECLCFSARASTPYTVAPVEA